MRRTYTHLALLLTAILMFGWESWGESHVATSEEPTLELAHFSVNDSEDMVYATPEGIFLKRGPRPLRLVAVGEEAPMTRGGRFRTFTCRMPSDSTSARSAAARSPGPRRSITVRIPNRARYRNPASSGCPER